MMRIVRISIAILFLSGLYQPVKSQFNQVTCKDSTLVSGNYCNGIDYAPVCGCDNITYEKECLALAQGIISSTQGPCEAMDFHIFTNPVAESCSLLIATKDVYDVNLWIFDIFSRQYFYQLLPSVYPYNQGGGFVYNLNVDVRGWGNGVYFVVMRGGGTVKVKRLLVNQLQF